LNFVGKFDAKLHVGGSGAHPDAHFHADSVPTHAPSDAILVADADLLFNGDFKRSGVDLILSRDDHELVVHDYFKGEKRATLASPDGARLTGDIINALAGHVEVAQADGSAGAGKVIGHVTKLVGTATAIRNGVSIILNQGDNVEKGDVVQSGSGSTLGVTFIDGTVFGLSSNARMVLNEMVYDPNGSDNSSLISLVAGTISFVAGQTAKHGDMKIDTPVATMGIRGTAVLVEIDFDVPGQNGTPAAKFQVLMEPDGTTGSYILFDKSTLAPIAIVDKAGQRVDISDNNVSFHDSAFTPELQKLITDVFTLKFTNTNPQTSTHFTDTLIPQQTWLPVQLANSGPAVVVHITITPIISASAPPSAAPTPIPHLNIPPVVTTQDNSLTERAGVTGSSAVDTTSGTISFADINLGDRPTAKATISTFTYQNAQHQDITTSAPELKDILTLENIPLVVVQAPGNTYLGTANWTFNVPDKDFDFLGAGDTLTLTYMAEVDSNYGGGNLATLVPFTITITGTNDAPVITTGAETVAFINVGTTTTGPNLPPPVGPTTNKLTFNDPDLTDTHTVSTDLASATLSGNGAPTLDMQALEKQFPRPMGVFEDALSAAVTTDSTGTGNGTITWTLADISAYYADIVPAGETLTLTYTVTVKDSQGATSSQNVIVTITGSEPPAVVWVETTADALTDPAPGDWNGAHNWETGAVPTASDDVSIITDQLQGQTPFYPVTVHVGETASANSVTMDDFSDLAKVAPELDVGEATVPNGATNGELSITAGLSLSADSILKVFGTLSVGTIATILGNSVLDNFGVITLGQGGQFGGSSSITNSGTIEVVSDELDVQVDIANTGGIIQINHGAALKLSGAAIDGGTITDNGTIDVTGNSKIDSGATLNNGAATVESGVTLTLDGMTVNGTTITDKGTIVLDDTVKLTGSATLEGVSNLVLGAITNNGTLEVSGSAELLNDTLTNTGGIVQIDALQTLQLNGTEIIGGTIADNSKIDVTGNSKIDSGATLNNGAVTVESGVTLTLDGMTVNGTTITDKGAIVLDDTVKLTGSATLEGVSGSALGAITNNGTLDVAGAAELLNDTLTNTGVIEVDAVQTLTLNGTEIIGGIITDVGKIDVTGASKIDSGATLNSGGVTVEPGVTLTLDGMTVNGTTITDKGAIVLSDTVKLEGSATLEGVSNLVLGAITNSGTLEVSGAAELLNDTLTNTSGIIQVDDNQILTLSGTEVIGGIINDFNGLIGGKIDVTGNSKIDSGATLNNGAATVESGVTLTLDGMTVNGTTITDKGTIVLDDTVKLTGSATLEGVSNLVLGAITNNGTLEVAGAAELLNDTLTNTSGIIQVDALQTLTLSGTGIIGGTLTNGGTLDSTSASTISNVGITNTGLIESTGGVLTIDPVAPILTLTNSGTLEANGGELDITSEQVNNTGTLQAIGGGTLKLTSMTVINTDAGTVTVGLGSTLDLTTANIDGGTVDNSGTIDNVSGSNTISADITNTETIEVKAGTLDLAGGLSGAGSLIIDTGATLELAGADAQTITFAGRTGSETLQLDNVLGFTGTIAGVSSTGGTFTIAGPGDITSASGDAIDFTASGGVVGNEADVTLTPSGAITGAANGIDVVQNGAGDLNVDPSGDVEGLAGDGVIAEDSATGTGNIFVNGATGSATANGMGSVGLLAENLNAANTGNITVTQLGGASGDLYGIEALTEGNGNISVEASGTIVGTTGYGILAVGYGAGNISVVTDGGSITSGSAGIIAVNEASAVPSANHSIVVTAHGIINSGAALTGTSDQPAGILAGYLGGSTDPSSFPLTGVNGDVTVNNYADITAAGGDGIRAFNYGIGDVTVNDDAGSITALGGTSPTNGFVNGISANNFGTGDINVITATGITIDSGGSGIAANNAAADAPSTSEVHVLAHGTITSGAIPTADGSRAAGIVAGYNGDGSAESNVHGTVVIDDYASINAAAGTDGIRGYNFGTGTITITTETGAVITAGHDGLDAVGKDGGDVNITNYATVSAPTAIFAMADEQADGTGTGTGTATIHNYGTLTGSVISYNATFVNESGAIWNLTGTSTLAGTSTIENAGTMDHVVSGNATLGDGTGGLTLTNDLHAVIDASEGTLILDTGATIANAGTLEATLTGTLQIDDSVTNTGTLVANGGMLVIGTNAVITGTTSVTIADGGVAEFAGGSSAHPLTLAAAFSTGGGTLQLDHSHSQHYGGTISGFGTGDKIDLTDLTYSTSETDVWNSATDTLTINNGTHSSSLIFSGAYNQNSFALTSDAHGDTEVVSNVGSSLTQPQVSVSGLDSAGNAVDGNSVVANFSAPGNGNPGTVTYTWLENGQVDTNVTGDTFTPGAADVGKVIDVVVGFGSEQITAVAGTVATPPVVGFIPADFIPTDLAFNGNNYASGPVATTQVGNGANDGVTLAGLVDWNGQSNGGNHGQVLFYNGSTSDAGFGVFGNVTANGLDLQILVGGVTEDDTGVTLSAGQWYDVALTHVNGGFTLYVDGVAEHTFQAGANNMPGPANYPDSMLIGGDAGGEGFAGSIGDVSVWNTALTQSQVQVLGTTSLSGSETGLAAYYPLNDGSGTTAADLVNAAGNLSLSGSPTWVTNSVTTNANTALTLNGLTVTDPDAGSNPISVTLDASYGTLSLGNATGVTESGTGLGNSPLILTGTLAAIDAALTGGVSYTPTTGYFGSDTLSVTANSGAVSSNTANVTINVAPPATPTITITVDTSNGLDFQHHNTLAEMGAGAIQSGGTSTSFTIVDSADNLEFVLDGNNFTYGTDGNGGVTVTGGTLTSFHEFTNDATPVPLADFTGLSVNAATWISDVQLAHGGNDTAIDALTSTFAYNFVGGSGPDTFGSAGHADTLSGTGADVFDGGGAPAGSHDTLIGGAGSTFVFQQGYGALTITNFDQAGGTFDANEGDQIQLNGLTAPLAQNVSYSGGNAILGFGNGDVVTLLHVTPTEYEALGGTEFSTGGNGGGNNSGPVIDNANNIVTYTGAPVVLDPSISVVDTTGTVTSVDAWISSAAQTGDALTINGNTDGTLTDSDGSTIHYHFDGNAISLTETAGSVTLADFDAALQLIEFSPGAADGTRTITWAAHEAVNTSPTVTTTVDVGPVLNSFTLAVSQGGTDVLTPGDFSVTHAQSTDFYSVQNAVGGEFEVFNGTNWVAATTGGFNDTQIAAGQVEFVQDGTATVPDFSISVSDGSHVSPAISPTVNFIPTESVADGATYTISAPSAEAVLFAGSTGTLDLVHPSTFSGVISNFAGTAANLSSSDAIDLVGFDAADTTVTSAVYAVSNDTGTTAVTVTDSSGGGLSTVLYFNGNDPASMFKIGSSSDGAYVFDPPATTQPATGTIAATGPNQILTGNAASDTFAFNFTGVGHATVTDFHPATDTLQFSSQLFANLQAALNATHDDGHGNTVLALDAHDTITLNGILKAQLQASDFHFV
jgi:hypothetical protein